jgi:hypothetical protein
MRDVNIDTTVASVRSLIAAAERSLIALNRHDGGGNDDWMPANRIHTALDTAYTQLMMLTDAIGLTHTYDQIYKAYEEATSQKDGLTEFQSDPDGDLHLLAASALRKFVTSIEAVFGMKTAHVVSKDVVDVLRATLYAITDRNCFLAPPTSEAELHSRVEAVLRCIFPDLDHKPPIQKAVKSFEPDTGLPSMRTLVEYKFVQTKTDVGRVADEILADTRGYKSSEWDKFIFLIYETHRLKSEKEWNRLLHQCGTAINTQAIVLLGEAPAVKVMAKKQK